MTVANVAQVYDEISALFKATWDVSFPTVPVLHEDVAGAPPTSGAWVRFSVRNATGRQASLAGEVGRRMFQHTGFVAVQLFAPTGDGRVLSDQLAQGAKDVFEGKATVPGDVRFRNVRIVHVGQEGAWYQTNVLADFEYEEVR